MKKEKKIEKSKDLQKTILTNDYAKTLEVLKKKIREAQLKAALSVNAELIKLYWEIGNSVHCKQEEEGWGAKTIEKLARDLKSAFPDMKGFSLRNIQFMTQFAKEYPHFEIVKQLVSQIPWGHNIALLQKLDTEEERTWYAKKTIENGWSRSVLLHWIDGGLHERQGKSLNNFDRTLTMPHSDLANQTLKDPYCFDFISLREKFDEKELENGLLDHIQKFLVELGAGFAFVGRQVTLNIGDQDFFLDLLFYHLKLRCFIVVELKAKEFTPKDAGQMNFYLSAVDDLMRHPGDNPTIGLLLCKTKNRIIVEYALRDIKKPLGVAEYETKIIESLPDNLKGSLPSIEELENELKGDNE